MQSDELRACWIRKGLMQSQVQKAIGIKSQTTMTRKVKHGTFTQPELSRLVRVLDMDDPAEICHILLDLN